jgi:3-hydroxymyristoyl/3-hydroxydecanoyl-(acyl carrier protein) dehydratase
MSALRAGLRARIEAGHVGGFFAGHFPGRPILPGVAQLHLVVQRLGEVAGTPVALRGIPTLRLRRVVLPGEVLELEILDLDSDGNLRFELRVETVIAAHGVLALGEPAPAAFAPPTDEDAGLAAPPAAQLLPHQPPARFVEKVLAERSGGLTVATKIPPESPFLAQGAAPALLGLEFAAQAAAAFEALRRRREIGDGAPRIGYFVGARNVALFGRSIPAEEFHRTIVQLTASAAPLSVYDATVVVGDAVVLKGSISTHLTTATGA